MERWNMWVAARMMIAISLLVWVMIIYGVTALIGTAHGQAIGCYNYPSATGNVYPLSNGTYTSTPASVPSGAGGVAATVTVLRGRR